MSELTIDTLPDLQAELRDAAFALAGACGTVALKRGACSLCGVVAEEGFAPAHRVACPVIRVLRALTDLGWADLRRQDAR